MSLVRELQSDSKAFFDLCGIQEVFLSADAAIEVCNTASQVGLVVARIEGGIYGDVGFMPRTDCIWDGVDPPITAEKARSNNQAAVLFVEEQRLEHNAFIVTAPPITGWQHCAVD
jgi:hypothetical protein